MIYLYGYNIKFFPYIVKILNKGHAGFWVNVYDNGNLLKGSSFISYT